MQQPRINSESFALNFRARHLESFISSSEFEFRAIPAKNPKLDAGTMALLHNTRRIPFTPPPPAINPTVKFPELRASDRFSSPLHCIIIIPARRTRADVNLYAAFAYIVALAEINPTFPFFSGKNYAFP